MSSPLAPLLHRLAEHFPIPTMARAVLERNFHPQHPPQLAVFLPTRLVGMQQVDVADLGEQLFSDHRFGGTLGLMETLVDGCYAHVYAEPVGEELLDAST